MRNFTQQTTEISLYDKIENARYSCQDLETKFSDFQEMIIKLKRKNNDQNNQKNYICIKIDFFEYVRQKIEKMQENFKLITNNFESIFDEFSYKNNKILEENEKMLHEIKCQFKCEIMKLDLNNKKQLELQNESNIKRENEFILFLKSLNSWIEKVEKNHLQELEEITISYQSNKQKLMNSKAKHLFLLNNFENDLFSEIKKIEKNNKGNLPFKLKTLQNGDNFFDINLISKISPIYNINQKNQFFLKKKNIVKPVVENKNKNIKFNDNINNTSKILENMVNISNLNIPNESYEIKEMDSEISMFLANHINNYQEESLNISMPKDEGKWDPAFDSEKSEKNTELNELKKAFEILENFNLFEGENLNLLQKCMENKKLNVIDKAIYRELLFQMIKMKKEKQFSKRDNISSRPQKEAIDISISFHEDENQLKNKLLKSHKKLNEDIASNIKAKDNSLSDLIFQDSSFYSPLGTKKLNDDHGLKHVKKEDLLNVRSLPVSFKKEVIDECLDENEKCSNFSNEKIKNDDSLSQKSKIYIEDNEDFFIEKKSQKNNTIKEDSNEVCSESKRFDEILKNLKNQIKIEKLSIKNEDDNEKTNIIKKNRSIKKHNKHHSEIFRSTPNASSFLTNFNSNSESKILIGKAKLQNNSSNNSNILRKILKKNNLNQPSNFLNFSNQFTNYEAGFFQNIFSHKNNDEDVNSTRSEPLIIENKINSNSNMFSKLLTNKEENSNLTFLLNSSFPGTKNQNKHIKKIFVKPVTNNKKNYTRSTHKSLESFESGNFSLIGKNQKVVKKKTSIEFKKGLFHSISLNKMK